MEYTVKHKCGHERNVYLFGKTSERESKIEWMKEQLCPECWKREQVEAAAKKTADLPALTGSEKQVQWATQIRAKFYESNLLPKLEVIDSNVLDPHEFSEDDIKDAEEAADIYKENYKDFFSRTESKFWIDIRDKVISWETLYNKEEYNKFFR